MKKFTLSEIPPVDLLDAARTIRIGHLDCCDWAPRWAPAQTFLEWAHRGLEDGGGYGLSNAIGYAKQTVACRIDGILRSYRVRALERANYPAKIDVLNELGVSIPQIIKELVIDPRNEVEHKYHMPTRQAARQAIEIAELFSVLLKRNPRAPRSLQLIGTYLAAFPGMVANITLPLTGSAMSRCC